MIQCLWYGLAWALLCAHTIANVVPSDKGGPGEPVVLDRYNTQWGWDQALYGPSDPQQIHLSWASQGKDGRVQFSTRAPIQTGLLKYWPVQLGEWTATYVERSEDWEFANGESFQRKQYLHMVQFGALRCSTLYRYRVGARVDGRDIWSAVHEFVTPDQDTETFKFLVAGDIGISNGVSMPLLRDLASERQHDFLAILGDQGYDLADFEGRKGDDFLNFAQPVYANIPTMTMVGNHENERNFEQYTHRFRLQPYRESGFSDATQYSFDYKSVHFVAISTEVYFNGTADQIEAAVEWLKKDLSGTAQPWIVVMGHRPLYCALLNLTDCGENAELLRSTLEPIFQQYDVDMYLCGHRHDYERTYPVANNQISSRSYINPTSYFQVITGNSGNYEGSDQINTTAPLPNWLARQYSGYGFSSIQVTPYHLELFHWETRLDSTRGRLIDHVKVIKSRRHTLP